jgi:predicted RNase H-like HicB family nuclease
MLKQYIGIIQKNEDSSDYGIIFPDFLGRIFTCGETIEELKIMAKEALEFHIEGMIERGEEIPEPSKFPDVIAEYGEKNDFLVIGIEVEEKINL